MQSMQRVLSQVWCTTSVPTRSHGMHKMLYNQHRTSNYRERTLQANRCSHIRDTSSPHQETERPDKRAQTSYGFSHDMLDRAERTLQRSKGTTHFARDKSIRRIDVSSLMYIEERIHNRCNPVYLLSLSLSLVCKQWHA